jgi:hypothetical protein
MAITFDWMVRSSRFLYSYDHKIKEHQIAWSFFRKNEKKKERKKPRNLSLWKYLARRRL